ncbi:30S ribosomal protein S9 [Candidatus Pacearchaeota archaeon]|nr:30S ribosomal protein S9 [Candidatus Pacearchaeota archaeon]|tara:strand:- start:11825 stop:12226 length:402 start_codon:yes stop_codon:yes gene_type:complete
MNNLVVTGKRKEAIAKATIVDGTGKITINKKPISSYPHLLQLEVSEPIIIANDVLGKLNFDISVNVKGGGVSGQIQASRLAISRAIVEFTKNEDVKRAFISYDRTLLIADTRRKETCKPGDSKARAMRQTSFR